MQHKNIPSPEQAERFAFYVKHWQTMLNLVDWRIEKGKKKAAKGAMAEVDFDSAARLATYRLGDFGAEEITERLLKLTALHECLHVFLYDLIAAAAAHPQNPETLEAAEHRVVNVLEKLLGEQSASGNH